VARYNRVTFVALLPSHCQYRETPQSPISLGVTLFPLLPKTTSAFESQSTMLLQSLEVRHIWL
jgi:hypothetical protein